MQIGDVKRTATIHHMNSLVLLNTSMREDYHKKRGRRSDGGGERLRPTTAMGGKRTSLQRPANLV
jgi:hypothetical protein